MGCVGRCLVLLVLVLGSMALASPADAQDGAYVAGLVFADLQRASGVTAEPFFSGIPKLDGTAIGGGIRGGVFLAPRWSLELGVDLGTTIDKTVTPQVFPYRATLDFPGVVPTSAVITPLFEERIRMKTTATSVLLGYHPPVRGRLRLGFGGGLSFMHTSSVLTQNLQYPSLYTPIGGAIVPLPFAMQIETVTNQLSATVGTEVAVAFSNRAAIVPEVRAHGFGDRFVIRPGVGVRWQW